MANFLSALSLVILVLANSCFTSPVLDGDITTISSSKNVLTTEFVSNGQLASNTESTAVPSLLSPRSSDEHLGLELSTVIDHQVKANATRVLRTSTNLTNDKSGLDKTSITTERPLPLATEERDVDKRQFIVPPKTTRRPQILTTHRFPALKRYQGRSLTTRRPQILTTHRFSALKRDQGRSLTTRRPQILTTHRFSALQRYQGRSLTTRRPLVLTTNRFFYSKRGLDRSLTDALEPFELTNEEGSVDKRVVSAALYDIVEPLLHTTERAMVDKNSTTPQPSNTTAGLTQHKRSDEESGAWLNEASGAWMNEESSADKRAVSATLSNDVKPFPLTTEGLTQHKRSDEESGAWMNEESSADKRAVRATLSKDVKPFSLTTEGSTRHKRSDEESGAWLNEASGAWMNEESSADKRAVSDSLSNDVKSFPLTTEGSTQHKRSDEESGAWMNEESSADKRAVSATLSKDVNSLSLTTEGSTRHKRSDEESGAWLNEASGAWMNEESSADKRAVSDSLSNDVKSLPLTTEGLTQHKRSDEALGAWMNEESSADKRAVSATLSNDVKPFSLTTEGLSRHKHGEDNSSTGSVESSILTTKQSSKKEHKTDKPINGESGIPIQKVERRILSVPTVDEKSSVSSKSTSEPTSGLKDNGKQVEKEERPRKPLKSQRKLKISQTSTARDNNVQSKEISTVPTAMFDQDASKNISGVPSGFMTLEETVSVVVTARPEGLFNTTIENSKQAKSLNQGQKSSDIEEKKSNN